MRSWQNRRAHSAWTAEPNVGHRALVDLERSGRLVAMLTQNIDGLHQKAGSSAERVLELHGTLWEAECLSCRRAPADGRDAGPGRRGRVRPAVPSCGGILKSATISFGQALDPDVLQRAFEAAADCELFLAVGSSLTVQPAAGTCGVAIESGARLVIVNAQPTPYDDLAHAVLRAPIADVLPASARRACDPRPGGALACPAMRVPLTSIDFLRRAEQVYADRIGIIDEPTQPAAKPGRA